MSGVRASPSKMDGGGSCREQKRLQGSLMCLNFILYLVTLSQQLQDARDLVFEQNSSEITQTT
jgi:hypothetical protein